MPVNQNYIKQNLPPIGISGAARSGKDTICSALIRYLSIINIEGVRRSIAGDIIKHDLKDFLMEKYSIDSFTKNCEIKENIRPILVNYGREKRNKTSGRYFIDKFIQKPNCVNIIPDIRYCEYANDELYWLKKEVNGILIFVDRKNIQDANEYEKNNNSYIKKQSNHVLNWDTLDEKNPNDLIVIDNFAKTIIDDIYLPFTNRTI